MGLSILLVEDDPIFAKSLTAFLKKEGHEVDCASTGEDGVQIYQDKSPDIVLQDLMLPGMDGMQTLKEIRRLDQTATVIVMTGHGSIEIAVEAMRLGASDFVTKPVDLESLCLKLDQVKEMIGMRSDLDYYLDRERRDGSFENIIGKCPAMTAVFDKIKEVAKTDNTTVLVTGPSGTGKELVAKAIHAQSARKVRPLMQIDCTSIPLSLMESELFGHERGAFTGADRMKKGLLEMADGGSLLLDEIGDMDITIQGKFLRVLQERQFRRVGGTRNLRFDVRLIAATNQDLDGLAESGGFRRDLLYRLKVFQIELPPLCERGEDILLIAEEFLRQYARSFRKKVRGFDEEAANALARYSFPGNIRELKNIVEQAIILANGELVTRGNLSITQTEEHEKESTVRSEPGGLTLEALGSEPLVAAERELIRQALKKSKGNKKRAAEMLGITRFTLQRKLEKYAVESLKLDQK